MIQGYRMAGPPPHGEPPPSPPSERQWPVWAGFVALAAVIAVSVIASAMIYALAGTRPGEDAPAAVDLLSSLALQLSLLVAALVAARLVKPVHPWQFGLRSTRLAPAVGWIAAAMAAYFVLAMIWAAAVGEPEQSTAEDIGADESPVALICAGVMFVVVAPVAEEMFFRGFFYGSLRTRFAPVGAAIVCGVVFGVIHASTGASAIPLLIALGVIFCLVRERTGSLYPCIAMHSLNNALAYATLTDVAPGIAAGFGAAMLIACSVVPRFAWRRPPSPA